MGHNACRGAPSEKQGQCKNQQVRTNASQKSDFNKLVPCNGLLDQCVIQLLGQLILCLKENAPPTSIYNELATDQITEPGKVKIITGQLEYRFYFLKQAALISY